MPVAIALAYLSVFVVDSKFGALILANLSSGIDCILLRIVVAGSPIPASTFYVPAAVGIGNNVMGVRSFFCSHVSLQMVNAGCLKAALRKIHIYADTRI